MMKRILGRIVGITTALSIVADELRPDANNFASNLEGCEAASSSRPITGSLSIILPRRLTNIFDFDQVYGRWKAVSVGACACLGFAQLLDLS